MSASPSPRNSAQPEADKPPTIVSKPAWATPEVPSYHINQANFTPEVRMQSRLQLRLIGAAPTPLDRMRSVLMRVVCGMV